MNLASRPSRRFRLVAAALLTLAGLAAPAGASASCAIPPGGADDLWKSADAVFVGTVTAIANNARWATVRVEEVWQGPDQPAEVVVRGGPEGNTATSVDRSYTVGIRYLFAVVVVDDLHEARALVARDTARRLADRVALVWPDADGGRVVFQGTAADFFAADDPAVRVQNSRILIDSLKKVGGQPRFTEYPGVRHNCWDQAYGTEELWNWLWQQKQK